MIRHPFARLVALFVALWLPFQAVAAVELASCAHGGQAMRAQATGDDLHAMHHHADSDVGTATDHMTDAGDCVACGACHLACTGFLTVSASGGAPILSASHVFAATAIQLVDQTSPDGLRRPPRPAA